jgi:hypothetical protein
MRVLNQARVGAWWKGNPQLRIEASHVLLLFWMCEALLEKILFPIATCCVYVCYWVLFLGLGLWLVITIVRG